MNKYKLYTLLLGLLAASGVSSASIQPSGSNDETIEPIKKKKRGLLVFKKKNKDEDESEVELDSSNNESDDLTITIDKNQGAVLDN